MILKELRLLSFGKFQEKEVSLKPGLNIVYGKNEAGKSTIHSFVRGMLFGIERQRGRVGKDDMYFKYLPWNRSGAYQGSIDITAGNKEYRIIRNFDKNVRECRIIDLSNGREIEQVYRDIEDIIPGLTESLYRNTVSIEQLRTSTEDDLAKEVRNYITNLSISKTNEVDVASALNLLNRKKKEIQGKLNRLNTNHLSDNLEKKLGELSKVDQLEEDLLKFELEEKEIKEKKEAFLANEDNVRDMNGTKLFSEMKPKIYEYMELHQKCLDTNEEYKKLTKSINDMLRVENSHKTIYRDIEKVNEIHEKLNHLKTDLGEVRNQEDVIVDASRKKSKITNFIPIACIILVSLVVTRANVLGISVSVGSFFVGLFLFLYRQHVLQNNLQHLEGKEMSIDRNCIELEAKKREIFIHNHVTGDAELRYKVQMLRENQKELFECKDKRKEIEKEQIKLYSRLEHITKDINTYAKYYFKDFAINEDLIQDIEFEVNLRKEKALTEIDTLEKKREAIHNQLERIKWELSSYAEFEAEFQREQKLYDEAFQNKCKLEKDLQGIVLAIESIDSLSIDIHDSFGDQINKRLSYIVEKVTNGVYSNVVMDENLNIKVLKNSDYISFDKLSSGAIAEIYLALRITIADILNGTKFLPLILDEAFVLYDDDRLRSTLKEFSNIVDRQIIIFTCHKREKQVLDDLKLDYNYVDLSH